MKNEKQFLALKIINIKCLLLFYNNYWFVKLGYSI